MMHASKSKHKAAPQAEDTTTLTQAIGEYLSYWPLFLISVILFGALAFVYNRYKVPLYEATATIIIKDEKKGNEVSKQMEDLDIIATKKISENEIEVLQSRSIMSNVVRKLNLYAPLKQEGKVKALSAYSTSPVIIEFEQPDKLNSPENAPEKIFYYYDTATSSVLLKSKNIRTKINEWTNTPYGRLRFLPNPRYTPTANIKPFYFEIWAVKDVVGGILSNLKVTGSKQSSIIQLTYKDPVPEKAEDILNSLIYYYNEAAVYEKNTMVRNTLASLEERLKVVKTDLDSIEKKVQQYKTGNSAVELNTQGNLFLQSVQSSDTKSAEVRVQMSVLDQIENYVKNNQNGNAILPSSVGVNDPSLTQMVSNLTQAQLEREKLRKTVAENHPMMQALNEQINKLKPAITDNIRNQRKNLELSLGSLNATTGKYSSMLNYIPEKEKQLLEISRDQQIKTAIYSFLLQKREESELSYASIISDSRVVNQAQASSSPAGPPKMVIYAIALLLGLTLPILFINLRDMFNNNILYRKEIEKYTHIPVITELTMDTSKKALVLESGKRTFTAEQFRKIRIALLYLGIEPNHKKKVLLTSSIPGEGKSFISSNLALSLASTGKKVVLVDLDLHNSSLGRVFDMEEEKGVSDYLANPIRKEEIIRETRFENLHFINAGTLMDNPTELLTNGRIEQLISELEHEYDLVIMDTAPIVFVTDAFLLTNLADATLFVVRHNHTPKMALKRLDEKLAINPLNNPAIIFNGIKTRGFVKNNYGYGYEYVYGKDYGKKK